jgi:hypothetical protein
MQQSSGLGSSLGSILAKAVKPKSAGSSVGKSVSKVYKPSRSSSSSSRRSSSSSSSSRSSSSSSSYRGGSSSSSRSSGGGGGGGSVGRSIGTSVAKSAPKPPDINSYLGTDSVYQNAVSGGKRSLADFLSELNRRKGEATTQYNTTLGGMERDRVQQLDDLRQEFASRGLINSGLYGEEQGKFQKQFSEQQNALGQQQTSLLADLMSQQTNYSREQQMALQAAKQEALARRAAKYKIGA